jgi:excisionase family DNA binding protein
MGAHLVRVEEAVLACLTQFPYGRLPIEVHRLASAPIRLQNCVDMLLLFHINASVCQSMQEVKRGITMAISFSVKVAADQTGLSERTIHSAIKNGKLKVMRVGRRVLITPLALENFLNEGTQGKAVDGA